MAAAAALPNISQDLVWEIVRNNNSFLAKSKKNGGVQFSRDPMNLTGKNSRKHAGFVNDKAIGVTPHDKGGVVVSSKNTKNANKPAKSVTKTTYGGNKTSRKTYAAVARQSAKSGYRGDLRSHAVERVSAIRRSQRPVKPTPETKLRGKRAQKEAAVEEE